MAYAISDAALDDRLAFVGTSGSGKTYAAGTAVEKLLSRKARAVIIDPLGVWWGLRADPDGSPSNFKVAIFGGEHGDLPLNEHAGKLIGEAVADTAESCIVDLSQLGTKSAERRFMLAFLEALYRKASGEPVHLIFDEADLWAPQKSSEPQLQSLMENIVRRGRVKGFVPWLITQRPAVLSKDVLSQADGLVAMKLTASQDRDALGGWIEGQADRAEEKRILARLPQLSIGNGVVWIPGRGVLQESAFPRKATFDSSRTPKRGEKRRSVPLPALDLPKLKDRLAKVEAETKANDPRALKVRIVELEREVRAKPASAVDLEAVRAAERIAYERGHAEGFTAGVDVGWETAGKAVVEVLGREPPKRDAPKVALPTRSSTATAAAPKPPPVVRQASSTSGDVPPARRKLLDAIAWCDSAGIEPTRVTVAFAAGVSPQTGSFANNLSSLRTSGLVDYPGTGLLALTDEGRALAATPEAALTHEAMMAKVAGILQPAHLRILQVVARAYPGAISRADIAQALNLSAGTGSFANNVSRLSSIGLVTYPSQGMVRAADLLFPSSTPVRGPGGRAS